MKIDYVMSGSHDRITLYKEDHADKEFIGKSAQVFAKYLQFLNRMTLETGFDVSISRLYNAYTESNHAPMFREHYSQAYSNIYADSGGLQVITQGKTITDSVKRDIYTTQDYSDYSFCFDEIPLTVKFDSGTNERSNTSNKLFIPSDFVACAEKTARNIVEQCTSLKNSKVFIIVQGNTWKDMVLWFDTIYPIVEPHLDKICGIAPADTCMGNGYLESCDMAYACGLIFRKYPKLGRRVHFLGVGSASRIEPIVVLTKSGVIPDDVIVSIDSSSMTMAFVMGKAVYNYDDRFKVFTEHLREFYSNCMPEYELDYDYIYDSLVTHQYQSGMSYKVMRELGCEKMRIVGALLIPMYCHWQVHLTFEKMSNELKYGKDKINKSLSLVESLDDYLKWRNTFAHKIPSKRIDRKSAYSIMDLFLPEGDVK